MATVKKKIGGKQGPRAGMKDKGGKKSGSAFAKQILDDGAKKKKKRTVRKASATWNAQAGTKSQKSVTKSGKYKETRKYSDKTVKIKELSSKKRTGGGSKNTMTKQKTTYKKGPIKKTVIKGRVGSPKSTRTVTRRTYKS